MGGTRTRTFWEYFPAHKLNLCEALCARAAVSLTTVLPVFAQPITKGPIPSR